MSEYVRKQALLEWLKEQFKTCGDDVTGCEALNNVMLKIVTGAFDAPDGEVQRLRAALGHIHAIAQSELDDLQCEGQRKTWEEILLTVEEALKGDGNDA